MKIITRSERESANAKLKIKAEELRAKMTEQQLARLLGRPHQGEREKKRRLKKFDGR